MYILVQAEFICGEFGQYFYHALKVSKQNADDKVEEYFKNYYQDPRLCEVVEENRYLYHQGQISVTVHGWQEITKEEYKVLHKFYM